MRSVVKKVLFILIFFGSITAVTVLTYISNDCLTTVSYRLASDSVDRTIRIVQVSDLHNHVFGTENSSLVAEIRKASPDLIFMTGDMLNQDDQNISVILDLIPQLKAIAPVYYSMGNHEVAYEKTFSVDLESQLSAAGAEVLDFSYREVVVKGNPLRIGGLYGYCLPNTVEEAKDRVPESEFLKEFQNTEVLTLLLCHMPVSWIDYGSLEAWDIDFIFAGHAHGGQVRIPGIGGLYAPDQGWFPGDVFGIYSSENGDHSLIISAGLGSSGLIPRFHNIPEIVILDIVPHTVKN